MSNMKNTSPATITWHEDKAQVLKDLVTRDGDYARFQARRRQWCVINRPEHIGWLAKQVKTHTRLKPMHEMLVTSEGETWRAVRRLLSQYFFASNGPSYFEITQRKTLELIEELSGHCGKIVDLSDKLRYLVSDIAIEHNFGEMSRRDKEMLIQAIIDYSEYQGVTLLFGPDVTYSVALMKRFRRSVSVSESIFSGLLDNYPGEDVENPKLLDGIVSGIETGVITRKQGIHEMIGMLLGSVEPNFGGVAASLLCLELNPSAKQRILAEQVDSVGDGHLSYDYIDQAAWLEAFVKESLRYWPPAWVSIRELQVDDTFGPNVIEKGTSVIVSAYLMHHHPEFWEQPEQFRPERFLSPELERQTPNTWLPFFLGTHQCVGKLQAMVSMKTITALFARHLVWEQPIGEPMWNFGIVSTPKPGSMQWQLARVAHR